MPTLRFLIVGETFSLMKQFFADLKADLHSIAESGRAAELVNRERFDGIFLSLSVPGTNGFDLVRWIRNSSFNRSTPIVAIVGGDDQHAIRQAFASGATFYVEKTADRHTLSSVFTTMRRSLYEHRRRFARVPLRVDLTCSDDTGLLNGETRNLSQGGLQVAVEKLSPGTSKLLSFTLPTSSKSIEVSGSVVWVGQERQGIKFEDIQPEQERAIQEYIAQTEAQDFPTE
jgi:CheY-like chemotaxis protein